MNWKNFLGDRHAIEKIIWKFDRAMVKNHHLDDKIPTPLKKRTATHLPTIPRFDNRPSVAYNKPMKYYYVMCQRGSHIHRAYVRLDPESADILHDALESRCDVCQVCDVPKADIDPDLLID